MIKLLYSCGKAGSPMCSSLLYCSVRTTNYVSRIILFECNWPTTATDDDDDGGSTRNILSPPYWQCRPGQEYWHQLWQEGSCPPLQGRASAWHCTLFRHHCWGLGDPQEQTPAVWQHIQMKRNELCYQCDRFWTAGFITALHYNVT